MLSSAFTSFSPTTAKMLLQVGSFFILPSVQLACEWEYAWKIDRRMRETQEADSLYLQMFQFLWINGQNDREKYE